MASIGWTIAAAYIGVVGLFVAIGAARCHGWQDEVGQLDNRGGLAVLSVHSGRRVAGGVVALADAFGRARRLVPGRSQANSCRFRPVRNGRLGACRMIDAQEWLNAHRPAILVTEPRRMGPAIETI